MFFERIKPLDAILATAEEKSLHRSLGWFQLMLFGIGLIGMEFTTIFTNALLPSIGPRDDVGRLSGSGLRGSWTSTSCGSAGSASTPSAARSSSMQAAVPPGIGAMAAIIDRQIMAILAEDIKADLGITDSELGFLYGTVFGVFYALFGIPLGRLADMWHRVRLLSIGLALWSGMTALSGMAQNFGQLAAARIGVGIGIRGAQQPTQLLHPPAGVLDVVHSPGDQLQGDLRHRLQPVHHPLVQLTRGVRQAQAPSHQPRHGLGLGLRAGVADPLPARTGRPPRGRRGAGAVPVRPARCQVHGARPRGGGGVLLADQLQALAPAHQRVDAIGVEQAATLGVEVGQRGVHVGVHGVERGGDAVPLARSLQPQTAIPKLRALLALADDPEA